MWWANKRTNKPTSERISRQVSYFKLNGWRDVKNECTRTSTDKILYSWSITIGCLLLFFFALFWWQGGNCCLSVLEMSNIVIIIMYEYDDDGDDAFEKDALENLYARMFLFICWNYENRAWSSNKTWFFVKQNKTKQNAKKNLFEKWWWLRRQRLKRCALFIESNGLVHIINCVAFTFLASVSKVHRTGIGLESVREAQQQKNYDVIRFIPSNLFVYGLWHSIFHRYRRERVPPPKKRISCLCWN